MAQVLGQRAPEELQTFPTWI